jgi:hypothetical protein
MALQTCLRRSICCSARLSSLRVEQLGWCVDRPRNGEKPLVVLTFSTATVSFDVGKWWKTVKAEIKLGYKSVVAIALAPWRCPSTLQ